MPCHLHRGLHRRRRDRRRRLRSRIRPHQFRIARASSPESPASAPRRRDSRGSASRKRRFFLLSRRGCGTRLVRRWVVFSRFRHGEDLGAARGLRREVRRLHSDRTLRVHRWLCRRGLSRSAGFRRRRHCLLPPVGRRCDVDHAPALGAVQNRSNRRSISDAEANLAGGAGNGEEHWIQGWDLSHVQSGAEKRRKTLGARPHQL